MSFIQNLFTSRDNNANASTYVGQQDRLWWNPVTNAFYYSDGNTPGGIPVGSASEIGLPGGPTNSVQLNSGSNTFSGSSNLTFNNNNLSVVGNIVVTGNISPAAVGKIGGIQPGPGVNISNVGLLTLDSSNIPFSFGDFYANVNILTMVNVDENMILATQGNAEVQLVGNIGFYKQDGTVPSGQFFKATNDGQITIIVTQTDNVGAINIVGGPTSNTIPPGLPGAMLHLTGVESVPCRTYWDGDNEYVALVARRWNGNVSAPTQVLAGNDVFRINSTAATNAGVGNTAFAQIRTTALEDQTTTAQGSSMTFTVTPVGSPATARVDVANITVANGVWATKFTTSGTVSATSNVTGGNLLTGGLISATANVTGGNIRTAGLVSATGNITGGNIIAVANVNTVNLNVTGISNLNSNANVKITGGSANTYLRTDGTGNLTWAPISPAPVTNVAANANSYTVDFSDNSLILLYQPTGTVNISLTNYTAGKQARVMIRFGATNYNINTGLANAAQSTEGLTTIPISGGGGHNTKPNATVQLLYTCFDNTAGNCYMAATYF